MIEAFSRFIHECYEHTGVPVQRFDVDQRIYDALVLDCKNRCNTPDFYPGYIELDGVLIYARVTG